MYAAHLAVGLAIKAAEPRVPMVAVMTAVFLPDLLWLVLSILGIEPVGGAGFFDGWSHSAASITVQALIMGMFALPLGRSASLIVFGATMTHLPLDVPIHPKPIELYPHSTFAFGLLDKGWGLQQSVFGQSNFWWVETSIVVTFLAIYARLAARAHIPANVVAASAVLVMWLQIAFG